jgi:MSHA pilin protein MshB
MNSMKKMKKQKGFTIIELVVVILLLGILTATALPRFMDVTSDAHASVVSAVAGGLGTSVALFRAQWFAEGQPNTVDAADFDLNAFKRDGYPMGGELGTVPASMVNTGNCADLFKGLLQPAGRPSITSAKAAGGAIDSVYAATGSKADFVAYLQNDTSANARKCFYVYTGQYSSNTGNALPMITYDATDGSVTVGTLSAN